MISSSSNDIRNLLIRGQIDESIRIIVEKVLLDTRISTDEAVALYHKADLGLLGLLAFYVNHRKNGDLVFFNKNFHIEPTNICIYNCSFCSYRREFGQEGSWELSLNEIGEIARSFKGKGVTEVHITGGVHPKWKLQYYGQIIQTVKKELPHIHVKAFSAVEIDHIVRLERLSLSDGLSRLKKYGLDSIPGGGAEIADVEIRERICGDKTSWKRWLEIHETAHFVGLSSNATMLYGHIENFKHRVEHMEQIRSLQDRSRGFNCFIPLKYKSKNNKLAMSEVNTVEDLKNYAIARIFLDNFKHIKSYWPMLGKHAAQLSLNYGVDDIDGTIDDSTKIYSMAGADDSNPTMTLDEICNLIRQVGKKPVERDSLYNPIKSY